MMIRRRCVPRTQGSRATGRSSGRRGARLACVLGVGLAGLGAFVGLHLHDDFVFLVRFQPLAKNEQGFREYRHRQTGIVFVRLPGASALLGSSEAERAAYVAGVLRDRGEVAAEVAERALSHEKPKEIHQVHPFLIAKLELTQGQWRQVMGEGTDGGLDDDVLPLVSASWGDCKVFCDRTGLRMPTEAEWEYACRSGVDDLDPAGELERVDEEAWLTSNRGSEFHRGGLKTPNGFGLFDMKGNAWEMCHDDYDEFGGSKPARGGSRGSWPWRCRCGARDWVLIGFGRGDVGFRPSYTAP